MSWVRRVVTWGLALAFVHVCVVDVGMFCRAVAQGGTPEYHAELKKRKRLDKQRLWADALLAQQEASTRPKRMSKLVAKRKGAALDAAPSERVSQTSAKMRKGKRRKYVSSEAMRQLNPEQ